MKKVFLSGIYLFLAIGIIAQTAVLNVKEVELMKDEPVATYFLPRTVLEVKATAVKTIRKAGPYSAEARKYLGTPAEIQQDEEIWTINKVEVRQKSEPDQANQYKVYAAINSNAALLTLTGTGILKGINLPFSFSSKAENDRWWNETPEKKEKKAGEEKPSGSLFISNFSIKENDSDKKTEAAVVFDQINSLRETRMNILLQSNDVLQEGSAVEAYLREIDKREGELTALFKGVERKEAVEKTFIVYPDKEMTNQEIFRFSEKQGFSDSGNAVTITLKKRETGDKPVFSGKGKTGFVYRVPALTKVEITGNKTALWTGEMNIAQLGRLAYLPAALFDKNDVKAVFDTKSGALLQVGK